MYGNLSGEIVPREAPSREVYNLVARVSHELRKASVMVLPKDCA